MIDLLEIADEDALENALSTPNRAAVDAMRNIDGPLLILGVGGKMGPSIARMARRALDEAGNPAEVIGVARFSDPALRDRLQAWGISAICSDLLEAGAVDALPDAPSVLYMAAMKFGATGDSSRTWAMNVYLPGRVAERYRDSKIVAFSTGNVYPFVTITSGGSRENDPLEPVGEYAMTAMGRERIFTANSARFDTPTAIVRLNYATDLRYGVLVDIAQRILANEPIDVTMGHFNTIWQGDANAVTLACFDHAASPPYVINLTGSRTLSVREAAQRMAKRMGKEVIFQGVEAPDALLSNATRCIETFGEPTIDENTLIDAAADWVAHGGRTLDKPTKFQVRDGKF